jgi:methanogenic corrinoid protein MtbC1
MASMLRDGREGEQGSLERHPRESWRDSVEVADGDSRPVELDLNVGPLPESPAAWLLQTIQAEIIPRLMLAHREPTLQVLLAGNPRPAPGPVEVAALAQMVMGSDPHEASAYVEELHAEGMSLEMIYLDLLAPTASRLGELWESDDCDFTEVTVGLWRLQQVMYELSAEFLDRKREHAPGHRALLAPAPGSQHTFGLFMVAEFFRRAGWDVLDRASVSADALCATVRAEWFDIVGLSVGSVVHVEELASVILDLRRASANPAVVVLVGGPLMVKHPELIVRLGADATASDAPHAVAQAEELVAAHLAGR